MIEIGGRPILWHIMKSYAHYGLRDFVICLGYRGYQIKEYFLNYCLHEFGCHARPHRQLCRVPPAAGGTLAGDSGGHGRHTLTGGRVRRVRRYLDQTRPFCLTYGDGLETWTSAPSCVSTAAIDGWRP